MTVSLNTAPVGKPAGSDPTSPALQRASGFDRLIDTADASDQVDVQPLVQAAAGDQDAAKSLDALLAALKLTLAPGAALLPAALKKTGALEQAATAKNTDGEQEEGDPAAAMLAAIGLPPSLTVVLKGSTGSSTIPANDLLAKPSSAVASAVLLGDVALPSVALPVSLDHPTLTNLPAVGGPDQTGSSANQLDRVIDTARAAVWLDTLTRDIAESAGAVDKMRFRMMPPSLGALDVSVERQGVGINVNMTAHTADARNLIADSRQQMVDSLRAQGVPLVQFSLMTASDEGAGHRPPTFFEHLIEVAAPTGTDLAGQPVETATAERTDRFA